MTFDLFLRILPQWAEAFALTLAVEVPLFVLLSRFLANRAGAATCSRLRAALAGAAGTCITHPLLWFVWPFVVRDYTRYIVTGELLVAVTESLTFYLLARPISLRRAAITAVLANAASFLTGMAIYLLLGRM